MRRPAGNAARRRTEVGVKRCSAAVLAMLVACGPARRDESGDDDTRAPAVAIVDVPAPFSASSTARFTFQADEAGSTFTCRVDDAPAGACTSPATFEGLADGPHSFVVEAADPAGNKGEARHAWQVDTKAPTARIDGGPSGAVTEASATFALACDEAVCLFECARDEAAFAPCGASMRFYALAVGAHRFAVRAKDRAGNAQVEPATREWSVVPPAPETLLDRAPAARTGDPVAQFAFHAVPAQSTFECAVDGEPFAPCVSPFARTVGTGAHVFESRAVDASGVRDPSPTRHAWEVYPATALRLVAANLTSGALQRYEEPGVRILQGLAPDVALLQEFNVADVALGTNTPAALRAFVDRAFGPTFHYMREGGASIANGIVSRWPIVASGEWDDPLENTRDYAWARIDVPGARDLWAVSLHLRANGWTDPATGATLSEKQTRQRQVQDLLAFLASGAPAIPADDYLVLGGDLNVEGRNETCIVTLRQQFPDAAGPFPVDQAANGNTSGARTKPLDWIVVDAELAPLAAPLRIGANAFPDGLVFDTRVYAPLADLAPALATDSAAQNMQHMAVVRAFFLPL